MRRLLSIQPLLEFRISLSQLKSFTHFQVQVIVEAGTIAEQNSFCLVLIHEFAL